MADGHDDAGHGHEHHDAGHGHGTVAGLKKHHWAVVAGIVVGAVVLYVLYRRGQAASAAAAGQAANATGSGTASGALPGDTSSGSGSGSGSSSTAPAPNPIAAAGYTRLGSIQEAIALWRQGFQVEYNAAPSGSTPVMQPWHPGLGLPNLTLWLTPGATPSTATGGGAGATTPSSSGSSGGTAPSHHSPSPSPTSSGSPGLEHLGYSAVTGGFKHAQALHAAGHTLYYNNGGKAHVWTPGQPLSGLTLYTKGAAA